MQTILLMTVLTLASLAVVITPSHAEGDRAGALQSRIETERNVKSSNSRHTQIRTERRSSSPQVRTAKPAPQHKRDFGYSGFVGKSF